jgi:hypothetical protein
MSRELLQLARDAMRSLMNGRDFGTGQTGYYLNIIRRIEYELNRPQPEQQFYPDWDMLKPFHERIAELEAELAKHEQSYDHASDAQSILHDVNADLIRDAKPEPVIVPFPSFMRKRVEQAIDNSINPHGMSVHDSKAKVLISDLKLMLLIADLAAQQLAKPEQEPRKEWVGLTDDEVDACFADHGWSSSAMYYLVANSLEFKLKEKNT